MPRQYRKFPIYTPEELATQVAIERRRSVKKKYREKAENTDKPSATSRALSKRASEPPVYQLCGVVAQPIPVEPE